ncbi:hypothetical protein BJY01DRAFT_53273 [Aspergillus pseudoustus]|uniref:Uncharacterized protein n=1 Tax=Aspergillus pseudoustus TaxID=1810923 RepID=A0ABR4J9I9_9EURO
MYLRTPADPHPGPRARRFRTGGPVILFLASLFFVCTFMHRCNSLHTGFGFGFWGSWQASAGRDLTCSKDLYRDLLGCCSFFFFGFGGALVGVFGDDWRRLDTYLSSSTLPPPPGYLLR